MNEQPNDAGAVNEQPPPEPPPPAEPEPGTPAGDEEEATIEEPGAENEHAPAFDVEAFVKALPDGVVLCPVCLGMGGVVADPPFDPHTHRCDTCDGRGSTRTGSLVSKEAERSCLDCNGRGWLENDPAVPLQEPARAAHFAIGTPRDHLGRTPDNPDFDWARVAPPAPPAPPVEQQPAPA